jgi:predicted alpha/beta-hydrolase family hydrolase
LAESSIRAFVDRAADPPVRAFLHTPATPNGNGFVLTHGAGSNAQAPLLVALSEAFCAAGFTVLRCDLPYRQVRSFGPPGPADAARDRAGLKNAIAALRKALGKELGAPLLAGVARSGNLSSANANANKKSGRIYLGGHSYGGRQCSILCAESSAEQCKDEPDLPAGLLLLSYPLHPPRRPEQQRTQHLPDLRTPALFVHGTRDPFGSIAEIEQALKMIPAETKLLPVEGAGHDLGFKGKARREELPALISSEFSDFFDLSS